MTTHYIKSLRTTVFIIVTVAIGAAGAHFLLSRAIFILYAGASSHIAAPLVVKQGYGLGARFMQGSDSDKSWNKIHFDFTFRYEGSMSNLSSFRFYEKKPGDYGFNRIAEFKNLLAVRGNTYDKSGTLALSRLENTWIIKKYDTTLLTTLPVPLYELPVNYPPGIYSYYVAAADSSGNEGSPSQIFNVHILQPFDVVSLSPSIEWTSVSGWPENQILYIIKLHDGQSVIWSKTEINRGNSTAYAGTSPLDPSKIYKAFIIAQWSSTLKPLDLYHSFASDKLTPFSKLPPPPPSSAPAPVPNPIPLPSPPAPVPTPQAPTSPLLTPKPVPQPPKDKPPVTLPQAQGPKEDKLPKELPPLPEQASEMAEERRPEAAPRSLPQAIMLRLIQSIQGFVDLLTKFFK